MNEAWAVLLGTVIGAGSSLLGTFLVEYWRNRSFAANTKRERMRESLVACKSAGDQTFQAIVEVASTFQVNDREAEWRAYLKSELIGVSAANELLFYDAIIDDSNLSTLLGEFLVAVGSFANEAEKFIKVMSEAERVALLGEEKAFPLVFEVADKAQALNGRLATLMRGL